jgi:hypothetical protein
MCLADSALSLHAAQLADKPKERQSRLEAELAVLKALHTSARDRTPTVSADGAADAGSKRVSTKPKGPTVVQNPAFSLGGAGAAAAGADASAAAESGAAEAAAAAATPGEDPSSPAAAADAQRRSRFQRMSIWTARNQE